METLRPVDLTGERAESKNHRVDRTQVLHFFERQGYIPIRIDESLQNVKIELERKLQESERYPRFHVIVSLQPLEVRFRWDEYRHHTPLNPRSWELTRNEIARILQFTSKDINSPAAETLRSRLRSIQYFGLSQIIHRLEEKKGEYFHEKLIKANRARTGRRSSRVKMARFKARRANIKEDEAIDDWEPI